MSELWIAGNFWDQLQAAQEYVEPVSTGSPEVKETEENSKNEVAVHHHLPGGMSSYQLPGTQASSQEKKLNVLKQWPLLDKAQSTGTSTGSRSTPGASRDSHKS